LTDSFSYFFTHNRSVSILISNGFYTTSTLLQVNTVEKRTRCANYTELMTKSKLGPTQEGVIGHTGEKRDNDGCKRESLPRVFLSRFVNSCS